MAILRPTMSDLPNTFPLPSPKILPHLHPSAILSQSISSLKQGRKYYSQLLNNKSVANAREDSRQILKKFTGPLPLSPYLALRKISICRVEFTHQVSV